MQQSRSAVALEGTLPGPKQHKVATPQDFHTPVGMLPEDLFGCGMIPRFGTGIQGPLSAILQALTPWCLVGTDGMSYRDFKLRGLLEELHGDICRDPFPHSPAS